MNKLKDFLDSYVVEFDWKDIGIFKLCLAAFGVMIGISLPRKKKKLILAISGTVFVVGTIALFARLFGVECPFCCGDDDSEYEDDDEDDDEEDEKGFVMKISAED